MTSVAQLTDEHVAKLRSSQELYARTALKITTKTGRMVELEANQAQRIVDAIAEEQLRLTGCVRMLVLKARQLGISTWVAGRCFRRVTLYGHQRALVIADKTDRGAELFRIYERFDENLPPELKPPKRSGVRKKELSYSDVDSMVSVETAGDTEAGRGFTIHFLHASELAMWENAEDVFLALMQAIPAGYGEAYIESTAKGVGNLFHRLWVGATNGENDWVAVFLPWFIFDEYQLRPTPETREDILATTDAWERMALDVGIEFMGELYKLTVEQLAWRRHKIRNDFAGDERTFRQEFPSTADEAFLVAGNAFFDSEALLEYDLRSVPPKHRGNLVSWDGGIIFRRAERGYLRVWEPPDPAFHYVIGADTASGRQVTARRSEVDEARSEMGGRDFSCADIVACCQLVEGRWERVLRHVGQYHGRMVPEIMAEDLWRLGYWFASYGPLGPKRGAGRPALIGVERNHASGQTVLRKLRGELRYPNLFYNRRVNTRLQKATEYLGWVTDTTTRQVMLDGLAAVIRTGQYAEPCKDSLREMFTFVRTEARGVGDGKPEAQEGCHDDRVISAAITVEMARSHTHDFVGETPEWVPNEESYTGM